MPVSVEQIKRRVSISKHHAHLESFVDILFSKANKEFMAEFDSESLFAITVSAYRFLQEQNDGFSLRVFNPEYQTDGWESSYSVVELSLKDRPFVVDSVKAAIQKSGYELFYLLHPIMVIERNKDLTIKSISLEGDSDKREAYELFFIERVESSEALAALEAKLKDVLNDVDLATRDYPALREKVQTLRQYLKDCHELSKSENAQDKAEAFTEYASFLSWLDEDNFVFLGYREYDIVALDEGLHLQATQNSSLGILRKSGSNYDKPVALESLAEGLRERVLGGRPLMVSKTNAESTVHRPVRMDYIGIKKYGENWTVFGEKRLIGLFTSKALATPVEHIPLLRLKLRRVLALDKAVPGSHDYKQITTIFNSMPRDGLFWADVAQLHNDIRGIMSLEQERGVRLSIQGDPLGRGLAAMVIMPRDRFNAEVRRNIQDELMHKLEASHVDYQLAMGEDESQLRFHFFFTTQKSPYELDVLKLEQDIVELTRTWDDHLQDLLVAQLGEQKAKPLISKYLLAFDESYRAEVSVASAPKDIEMFERLSDKAYLVDLLNPIETQTHTEIRIYHKQKRLVLSHIMPLLENLGFVVLEQAAYQLKNLDLAIDVFSVTNEAHGQLDLRLQSARLIEALSSLLLAEVENDPLNKLLLLTELSIRQVAVLLTYRMYYVQLNATASRSFVTETLLNHPALAERIYLAFAAKFDSSFDDDRLAAFEFHKVQFEEALSQVPSLVEDTVLRRLFNLVEASLRTNFYLNKPFISIKFASQRITSMPEPRPLYEIAVYGLELEGTHLRGGQVARGGIRWSDRPDDFRTEVLGLMKTQMTKNAVIVPVGSKGGFVVKHAPKDRNEVRAYVEKQYQNYIRSLLDITDNRVQDVPVHPKEVIVYDDYDPYLVVAADKGTATFSDIANAISMEYDFWLGDAFASGGSNGYDHKKEAITARGAWECVKRHFFEMDLDVFKDEFTAFGVGDMSGDVFGNGMLYTNKLKLLAAFNHLHIFLDPKPDAAASFKERKRLFELPRSSWSDYKPELISEGGGVFDRASKAIPLSPQVQDMLGLSAKSVSGQELIKHILKMKADLFWNGGIGTYVKASYEQHSDVGDSANDAVRIDAPELAARVVGEGGNLGFTQLGRIEYALKGGRINTDAIDNSAGVDMSDHEVNLKILLQPLVVSGELSDLQRNTVLEQMTDEVSELVLKDNRAQSLSLSLAQKDSKEKLALFLSLIEQLTKEGTLNPQVEFLPDRDSLNERQEKEQGLSRPELAILLAYSKMLNYQKTLNSSLPDDPSFEPYLLSYFPEIMQKEHKQALQNHSLKREIIATQITNQVTDILGMTYLHELSQLTSASMQDSIKASFEVMQLIAMPDLLEELERLGVSAEVNYRVRRVLRLRVMDLVQWRLAQSTLIKPKDLALLEKNLATYLPKKERKNYDRQFKDWLKLGLSDALAQKLLLLAYLPSSLGVFELAVTTKEGIDNRATAYYEVGEVLHLGWWRDELKLRSNLATVNKWEKRGLQNSIVKFRDLQRDIAFKLLEDSQLWKQKENLLETYKLELADIKMSQAVSLASADVALSLLAGLA